MTGLDGRIAQAEQHLYDLNDRLDTLPAAGQDKE